MMLYDVIWLITWNSVRCYRESGGLFKRHVENHARHELEAIWLLSLFAGWSPIECFCWWTVDWKVNLLWQFQWTFQITSVFVDGKVLFNPRVQFWNYLSKFMWILSCNLRCLAAASDGGQAQNQIPWSMYVNPRFFSGMLLTSMTLGWHVCRVRGVAFQGIEGAGLFGY